MFKITSVQILLGIIIVFVKINFLKECINKIGWTAILISSNFTTLIQCALNKFINNCIGVVIIFQNKTLKKIKYTKEALKFLNEKTSISKTFRVSE